MKFILSLICWILFCFPLLAQDEWKLEREETNIQVFTRKIPGEPLKEFKAQMEAPVPPEQILALLLDWKSNPTWTDRCSKTELVEQLSAQHLILHSFIETPWPVSDRDMVFSFEVTRKEPAIICNMIGLPDRLPPTDKLVRITNYRGEWRLTPLENGKTQIVLQSLVDPGGSIPDWLANSSVVDSPFATMKNLSQLLVP
ncbi:MAG: START domain-containing protein [Bacteroidota bacterium]